MFQIEKMWVCIDKLSPPGMGILVHKTLTDWKVKILKTGHQWRWRSFKTCECDASHILLGGDNLFILMFIYCVLQQTSLTSLSSSVDTVDISSRDETILYFPISGPGLFLPIMPSLSLGRAHVNTEMRGAAANMRSPCKLHVSYPNII